MRLNALHMHTTRTQTKPRLIIKSDHEAAALHGRHALLQGPAAMLKRTLLHFASLGQKGSDTALTVFPEPVQKAASFQTLSDTAQARLLAAGILPLSLNMY